MQKTFTFLRLCNMHQIINLSLRVVLICGIFDMTLLFSVNRGHIDIEVMADIKTEYEHFSAFYHLKRYKQIYNSCASAKFSFLV